MEQLIEYGKLLEQTGLTLGIGGNLSYYDRVKEQMYITPSGIPFGEITREDINAVIHAHTTYATVFAVLNEDLPASHYMLAVAGKNVRCASYASYGTPELAENAFEAMVNRKAALLANHGIIAGGAHLGEAFNIIREVEYCAKIHIMARALGDPRLIPDEEMANMHERFKSYGQFNV